MGGFLRCNLFYDVDHQQVYEALDEFWQNRQHRLADADSTVEDCYTLHQRHNDWTVLEWTRGWEWDLRRRAQLHVSRTYDCPGLLTFVYDGDLWGYELFHHGTEVDHFVQWVESDQGFFPDVPRTGRPDLLVAQFPDLGLDLTHARGYLTSVRLDDDSFEDFYGSDDDPRNRPVREGDRSGRLDAFAVFDFWRFLGVEPDDNPTADLFAAPVWRRFTTEPA
ncbi:hypothetical protein [Actinacidiphila paucisporea]|uniref:Uncharacterized protein n=1 Tax=Actinacidiphila paucisporea TaxID=310782 RepID=A0A1M7LZ83_9ACTN|nr:hypothetical protein [Actinacidiphila paucisporea]SHM83692.1 hypothetical protein SAMN05216499_11526 [Actinacidiphila paucisporea]